MKGKDEKLNYSKHMLQNIRQKVFWGLERYSNFKKIFEKCANKIDHYVF